MYKIAIIGDRDSVLGFMALGFATFEAQSAEEAGKLLHRVAKDESYGVIFIVENYAEQLSEEEFFSFLKKRMGILDGVCVTGGEPLLQPDILPFLSRIREFGLLVKLDTNGSRPEVLQKILDAHLVDYVAMDLKNSKEKYALTCGLDAYPEAIDESITLAPGKRD